MARDGGGARPGPLTSSLHTGVNPPRHLRVPSSGEVMHGYHRQQAGRRSSARRAGLALAWLAMLAVPSVAAAAVVIGAYGLGIW